MLLRILFEKHYKNLARRLYEFAFELTNSQSLPNFIVLMARLRSFRSFSKLLCQWFATIG